MACDLHDLVTYLESYLSHDSTGDYPGAFNGLQLENSGKVEAIVAGVDAHPVLLERAANRSHRLLLVHHGLGWNGFRPITGRRRSALARAIGQDLAVFSSHLPLDAHPECGNNFLLASRLGFPEAERVIEVHGTLLARKVEAALPITEWQERLNQAVGHAHSLPFGPDCSRRVLISSGSGKSLVSQCVDLNFDTLITGEISHDHAALACELGLNVILGGHYQTETLGVRALAEHLGNQFDLAVEFIDIPTGL